LRFAIRFFNLFGNSSKGTLSLGVADDSFLVVLSFFSAFNSFGDCFTLEEVEAVTSIGSAELERKEG
jgi:hypothetical protein